jgi:hypothetical protein
VIAAGAAAAAQCGVLGDGLESAAALALHAVATGLAYLFFVNVTKRKLGAPLIAATLFGAHPLAAGALAGASAFAQVGGAALGLLAGVLLARTPLQPRLLWPALAAYAAALPLDPGVAAAPFLVAAGAVAYHGLEPKRLFTKRLMPRFAAFLVPLGVWTAWSAFHGGGRGFGEVAGDVRWIALPFTISIRSGDAGGVGVATALVAFGLGRLQVWPKGAWPLLGAGLSIVAAATLADAWGAGASMYAALAFVAMAAGEGLEELFYRFGGAVAAPLLFLVYGALATLSHLRPGT